MQRNFDPMRGQVEAWQRSELTDVTAKVVIYEAFVEGRLEAPQHLTRTVHDLYLDRSTRNSAADNLEPIECVFYVGVQGTRSDSSIQGNGETGKLSRELDSCNRSDYTSGSGRAALR